MSLVPASDRSLFTNYGPDLGLAEQLFNIRYKYAVKHASGMERLAFKVLPKDLLRSMVLTLDPQSPFALSNAKFTPPNRARVTRKTNLGKVRFAKGSYSVTSVSVATNCYTCKPTYSSTRTTTPYYSVLTPRPDYIEQSNDTSASTRPAYSDIGGFESFTFNVFSPERVVNWVRSYHCNNPCGTIYCPDGSTSSSSQYSEYRSTHGGHAYMARSDVDALRSATITRTKAAISANLSQMVASTLPSARKLNIARSIVELKDLPRSILSLRSTLSDLAKMQSSAPRDVVKALSSARLPKHIPEEWLSFWFSWRATYEDLVKIVTSTESITKHVNFLIARSGKETILRHTRKVPGEGAATPAFTVQPATWSGSGFTDVIEKTETNHRWDTELRLVMSVNFDFPEVGLPKLRKDTFIRKYGLVLTPTDLYKLIPWSWLVDWFTGLGNYVEMIDNINTDPKTVNWAVITGVTTGLVATSIRCKYDNLSQRCTFSGLTPIVHTSTIPVRREYMSRLEYKCTVRQEVGASFGVKNLLKQESLTPYQQSIVGAILATRSGITRA